MEPEYLMPLKAMGTLIITLNAMYVLCSDTQHRLSSIGKKSVNIKVVDKKTMQPISIYKSVCRNLIKLFIMGTPITVPLLLIAHFNKEHASLHDIICSTRVINVQ
jgi:uncharacterized RDD family membrane protein YckC